MHPLITANVALTIAADRQRAAAEWRRPAPRTARPPSRRHPRRTRRAR